MSENKIPPQMWPDREEIKYKIEFEAFKVAAETEKTLRELWTEAEEAVRKLWSKRSENWSRLLKLGHLKS